MHGISCLKLFADKFPVNKLAENCSDVFRAAVFIIEIVGMLPDIDTEQRFLALCERITGILHPND